MQRIKSLDLARGFTVLMIAPIHTVLLYSKLSVRETLMGKLMAFIAEGPGAQLFMLLLGLFFAIAPQKSFMAISKKTLYLMYGGIALNIAKFVILHFFGWLPADLLHDLNIQPGGTGYMQLIMIGDILQFASIALLIVYLISRLPHPEIVSLIIASIICLISPFAWDLHSVHTYPDYLLQLLGGRPPQVFFPVFPWLVYPLVGLSLGIFMKKEANRQHAFWLCRDTGWILVIIGSLVKYMGSGLPATSFYRTYYDDTMIHLGIVLITLSVWEWISRNVKDNHFFEVLSYMSRNITGIYVIQWILICWLLPLFGYHDLVIPGSLFAMSCTTGLTITISFFFKKSSKTTSTKAD
jgi:uncharacterized membrane protein